jgi:hypothetical protein
MLNDTVLNDTMLKDTASNDTASNDTVIADAVRRRTIRRKPGDWRAERMRAPENSPGLVWSDPSWTPLW